MEPLKAQITSLLEDNSTNSLCHNKETLWGIWLILKRLSNKYREWSWLKAEAEREDEYLRCWNALGEDDRPKLDKERSLGYVRRAKRRQHAGDERVF